MIKSDAAETSGINPDLISGDSPFTHKLLIATPSLSDGVFNKSLVYICAHSAAGAMGLVINQPLPDVHFADLLPQLKIPEVRKISAPVVHFGGPVDTGRGFVLHSDDFMDRDTLRIHSGLCITGTIDILKAIAEGKGPGKSLFALGYAGWGAGQLEEEMAENAWLTAEPDEDILFNETLSAKWEKAMRRLGVHDPLALSSEVGHA